MTPPLPDERAVNRAHAEREKERKDAEKRHCDRKRNGKEAWEKENQAWEKEGKVPIPTPDSMPEPESPSPVEVGQVDYSMLPDLDAEQAKGEDMGA